MLQGKIKLRFKFFNLQLATKLVETLCPKGVSDVLLTTLPPLHPKTLVDNKSIGHYFFTALQLYLRLGGKEIMTNTFIFHLSFYRFFSTDPFAEFSKEKVFFKAIFKTNFRWTVKILLWHIFTFCYYLLCYYKINLILAQNNKNLTSPQPRTSTLS